MHVSKLSKEQQAALAALIKAEDALICLGFCVFRQASIYIDEKSAHFSTRVSVPGELGATMFDHSFADAVRDLSVEWSNAAHQQSKLVWQKATPGKAVKV